MIIPPLIEPEDSNLVCEENFILYKRGDWNATSDVPTEVKDYKYYSGSQILEFTAPNQLPDTEVMYQEQLMFKRILGAKDGNNYFYMYFNVKVVNPCAIEEAKHRLSL